MPCNKCYLCADGRYNLCRDVQFAGVYPYHGSLQRYKVHPARWLHKLPENVSNAMGALLEPLSVSIHGVRSTGQNLFGRGVVVCGAGPIGLLTLAVAKASGACPIVITDLEGSRLKFAQEFAPGVLTYQIRRDLDAEQNAAGIRALFDATDNEYAAPDTILECTGVESSVCTACYTARRGGVVMVIGVGRAIMNNLPFMHISLAEIHLKFINRYRDTCPPAIKCLETGVLQGLEKLVSHTFPLEHAKDALELASDTRNGSIKVMVVDSIDITL